ncbi:hypothetical protein BOO69_11100 [Sulfitobacter alexandrii]|uniref:DUF1801 domain-containing protein n=1 Tax=Sulfitobacter alexandrii TaxID=1917485 RepID=A0A1J0WID2_9RHOB|nr:DUF1801 domain-containing protein [Sulfitobacter alexandrii]APE43894.1 hypothetical protein BOO69_11100 [Sulfitobacter alexandrii]
MQHAPAPLLAVLNTWPAPARDALWACRALFFQAADRVGVAPLEESLKWGQPAWRPSKPRTGSTLRMDWSPHDPDRISFLIDCKTDLAARMRDIHPDMGDNDGRRRITCDLGRALPEQAVSHLAEMTFCYHLSRRGSRGFG